MSDSHEPHPHDIAGIERIASRTDVVSADPIGCRTRWHAGRCTVETLSDGTMRHRETFSEQDARIWNEGHAENVHVMTTQGFRLTRDGRRVSDVR
jgi:hypothetical protein